MCQEAEPHLKAFASEVGPSLPIVRLNPNLKDWRTAGFHPRYTPSYALVDRSNLLGGIEGQLLTTAQLHAFLKNPAEYALERKRARRRARAAEVEDEEPDDDEEDE